MLKANLFLGCLSRGIGQGLAREHLHSLVFFRGMGTPPLASLGKGSPGSSKEVLNFILVFWVFAFGFNFFGIARPECSARVCGRSFCPE